MFWSPAIIYHCQALQTHGRQVLIIWRNNNDTMEFDIDTVLYVKLEADHCNNLPTLLYMLPLTQVMSPADMDRFFPLSKPNNKFAAGDKCVSFYQSKCQICRDKRQQVGTLA